MNEDLARLFHQFKAVTGDAVAAAILTQTQWQGQAPAPAPNEIDMMTVDEAAKLLSCSANTVYRLVSEGKLESHRVGRSIRISRGAVDDYLAVPIAGAIETKADWR